MLAVCMVFDSTTKKYNMPQSLNPKLRVHCFVRGIGLSGSLVSALLPGSDWSCMIDLFVEP